MPRISTSDKPLYTVLETIYDTPSQIRADAISGRKAGRLFGPDALHKQAYEPVATNFDGKACKVQPKVNQIPELDVGKKGDGCQVKTYRPDSHPAKEGDLDIPDLYKKANEQNVQIKLDQVPIKGHGEPGAGVGSGVIIGRKGDEVLVMTDNHVLEKHPGQKIADLQARFGDGHVYNGKVVARDLKNDTAIIAFKTGANTEEEYHPATFQDGWSGLKKGQKYLTTGYPEFTSRLHASPGELLGVDRSSKAHFEQRLPGEDHNRFWGLLHQYTREGNSGGPTYNKDGVVVGTLEGGLPGDTRFSFINPISRQYVAKLLKQVGADSANE